MELKYDDTKRVFIKLKKITILDLGSTPVPATCRWKSPKYTLLHTAVSQSSFILPVCLPSLYLPSQPANSLKVTRLSRSWSSRVKVRLATVSVCWFEPPGHGASSPYRLLNWGRSSRYCRSM